MNTAITAALAALSLTATTARAQESSPPATADGPIFAITANHVGISVPDLDASIEWYRRMLGFELVRKMSKDADPKMDSP